MTVLLLIRHGHTEFADKRLTGWMPGVHLSERGRGEAERAARRLDGMPIAAIYSSPLERCRETAAPLAGARGLPVETRGELGEVRFGAWTNRTLAQVRRTKLAMAAQHSPSTVRFPQGESYPEVQARALREVERLVAAHPKQTIALFSHGDVIRLLLAHFAGMHMDQFQRLVVDPASISVVVVGGGPRIIYKMNDTGDLSGFARWGGGQRVSRRKVRG
jgi:probable phosphomutase (TIGR03848 family)